MLPVWSSPVVETVVDWKSRWAQFGRDKEDGGRAGVILPAGPQRCRGCYVHPRLAQRTRTLVKAACVGLCWFCHNLFWFTSCRRSLSASSLKAVAAGLDNLCTSMQWRHEYPVQSSLWVGLLCSLTCVRQVPGTWVLQQPLWFGDLGVTGKVILVCRPYLQWQEKATERGHWLHQAFFSGTRDRNGKEFTSPEFVVSAILHPF